jgi:chitinase
VVGGEPCNSYSPNDTTNYLAFVTALRAANPSLILTAAAGIAPWKDASQNASTDVSGFAAAFDWIAIMNYDEFGQWSTNAGPNAALDDSCALPKTQQGSATGAVKAWTAAGVPAGKLVLGVPTYGRAYNVNTTTAFTSVSSTQLALFPAFSPWALGPNETAPTDGCGNAASKDVIYTFAQLVQDGFLAPDGTPMDGMAYKFDGCSQTPFLYDARDGTYVSYDDASSVAAKGAFVRAQGLRGFAMWEASGDYQDILVNSMRDALGLRL